MNKMIGAVAVLTSASVAMAGGDSEEMQSFDFSFPLSPGSVQMEFDQFDDMGGTRILKEVRLSIDATLIADATAENDSELAAPLFELQYNGSMQYELLSLSGADLNNASMGAALAATDGVAGSGPDFNDFGTVMLGLADNDSTTTGLAGFIGNGMIFGDLDALGGFSFSGTTDASLGFDNFGLSGKATLVYVYNVVPAPGAAALFGLAGLSAARRRR